MWPLRTAVSESRAPGRSNRTDGSTGKDESLEESVLESRNFSKDSEKRYNGI